MRGNLRGKACATLRSTPDLSVSCSGKKKGSTPRVTRPRDTRQSDKPRPDGAEKVHAMQRPYTADSEGAETGLNARSQPNGTPLRLCKPSGPRKSRKAVPES